MNIYRKIENEVKNIIGQLQAENALPADINSDKVEATPTRDPAHGDVATNAAMVLAAQLGKNPKEISEILVGKLRAVKGIDKAEIAGPGFINMTLAASIWQAAVLDIISEGRGYGKQTHVVLLNSGCIGNAEVAACIPSDFVGLRKCGPATKKPRPLRGGVSRNAWLTCASARTTSSRRSSSSRRGSGSTTRATGGSHP